MQLTRNRAIWIEIMQYSRISFTDDSPGDVRLKRRIMLSVALTCLELVEIGLNELWRTMTTLEPITQVINALCSSSTPALRYQDQGYWVSATSLRQCIHTD